MITIILGLSNLCLISNKHARLLHGYRDVFPFYAHQHYLQNLCENFLKIIKKISFGDVEVLCQKNVLYRGH